METQNIKEIQSLVKKAANIIHETMYSMSMSDQEKPLLVAGIIAGLSENDFKREYRNKEIPERITSSLLEAIHDSIKNFKGIDNDDKQAIFDQYQFIKNDKNLLKIENNKVVIRELIITIEETVFTWAKEFPEYDIIGEFYNAFNNYSSSDQQALGIVLTPHHIAEFMATLLDMNDDDCIMDIACGTGSLLLTGEAADGKIGNNKVLGVERNSRMMALCIANMIIKNINATLWLGDSWDKNIQEQVKKYKPTKMILNPPYDVDGYPELGFVSQGLDMLQPGGKAVVVLPMSCAIKQTAEWKRWRKEILSRHTLLGAFSMPDQSFYPVNIVTIIMVFEVGTPNGNNKSFFGYLKDDGFEITRTEGRKDTTGKWFDIRSEMLDLYNNKQAMAGKSALVNVDEKAEWCCEAYMETDYSNIKPEDFIIEMKDFVLFIEKEK